jgi:ornithine carbamoyltransferase
MSVAHFINIHEHSPAWLGHVLDVSRRLRQERTTRGHNDPLLAGKTLAMLFEKPSLRTRVSFEGAIHELGGHAVVLSASEVGLGKRESCADVARVLSGMVHAIMARVFEQDKLKELRRFSSVPVINALSDSAHPCQALADILTLQDEFGADLRGRKLAFIGDGNNVARSLAWICAKLGMRFALAAPPGYLLEPELIDRIHREIPQAEVSMGHDPAAAVQGADALYTDTFVSMGQEEEKQTRLKAFKDYQVNEALIARAPKHGVVLHCLPAYRGVEITDGAMDGPQSRVFPQAHNRLHAQKGLLAVLMGGA